MSAIRCRADRYLQADAKVDGQPIRRFDN